MTLANLQLDDFDGQGKLARDHGASELPTVLAELALRSASWFKDAVDGAAGTTTAERAFHHVYGQTQTLKRVVFVPGATLTAHDSNYATLRVRKRSSLGADGGIMAEVMTTTGGSGDWAAHVPVVLPLTVNKDMLMADGDSLTVEILKASSGVAVPVGALKAFFK